MKLYIFFFKEGRCNAKFITHYLILILTFYSVYDLPIYSPTCHATKYILLTYSFIVIYLNI